jgi:hypothetical protein
LQPNAIKFPLPKLLVLGQRNYKPAHNVPGIYKVLMESKKVSLMHGTVPLFIVVRYNFV